MKAMWLVAVGAADACGPAEAGLWACDDGGFYLRALVLAETLGGLRGTRADACGE